MAKPNNQLMTIERKDFGGTYFDSMSHAAMFRKYKPFNFGVRTAQLFSSKLGTHLLNKKFTYMTVAKGNVYTLPYGVDDYEWKLVASADIDYEITELLTTAARPGQGGERFKIAINKPWVQEPVLLKTESANAPFLKVIGQSKQRGANSWELTVKLQSGDPAEWLDPKYIQPGRTLIDAGTQVSDELNTKYGGIAFGEMFKLQSWTGNFARKAEFTDKFIRYEIGCRTSGQRMSGNNTYSIGGETYADGAVGVGYVYQQPFRNLNGTDGNGADKIYAGVFISKVEARLMERIERDREFNCEWGRLEKTADPDTDRTIKTSPGWRQLVKDGHFKEHNGALTLSDLYEYVAEIFTTRRDFSDRKIIIASGEGGSEFLHRLIAIEASQFQTVDTHFIRSVSSMFHSNALEYGSQFTSIKLPNGYVMQIVYDPIKDDRQLFPEKAPGSNRTLESYAMDFFDFGATDQKALDATRDENMTMVQQGGVESYFTVSNVYDFMTGAITDGSNAYANSKEAGIYREMSGGLGIWDITRCGRLEFNPAA